MTEDTGIGGLIASGLIIVATLGAGFFGGALWEKSRHQATDLKAAAAAANETAHQTIKNATAAQAEEGKLIAHAQDTSAAVATAKQRIDALPKPPVATCVPDLAGKGYVIINAPDPDEYWRAFADGYNSVLDRAAAGESAAVHPLDGAEIVPARPSGPQ